MKKYIVWKSIWEGEYVRAEDVMDDGETVTFLTQLKAVRAYKKAEILDYHEVTE